MGRKRRLTIRSLLLAFQFLTIVPVRIRGDITEKDVASSVASFPLVGLFQGIVIAVPALGLALLLPADVAAGFALLCLILTNLGFDLDGLADTFDGLAVKSTGDPERDRAKRLIVMKESATGAIGVIAIVMVILLKLLLIRAVLSAFPAFAAGTILLLMPVFSKWITVPAMYHARSAREEGLGKIFIDHTGLKDVTFSTVSVIILFVLAALFHLLGSSSLAAIACYGLFCCAACASVRLATKLLQKKFGGLTGDHFGAVTEIGEVLFLLWACLTQRVLFPT